MGLTIKEQKFSPPPLHPHEKIHPFEKNSFETQISEWYKQVIETGGLRSLAGWKTLVGEILTSLF